MAFRSLASTIVDGNVTINSPAGLATGDVLLIAVSSDTASASFGTTPSGLTVLSGPTSFGIDNQNIVLYGCIWNGTQSLSFTPSASAENIYLAVAFSGRVTTSIGAAAIVQATTPAGPSTSVALTGATAAAGDDIAAFSMPDPVTTATTQTPPAGYTEPTGADLDSPTHVTTIDFAYKENVSAGATGTLTFTASHSVEYSGWVIRLAAGSGRATRPLQQQRVPGFPRSFPLPGLPRMGFGMLSTPNVSTAQSHSPLVADQASFTLTGNAANLVAARVLTATQASFSLTGQATNLDYAPSGSAAPQPQPQGFVTMGWPRKAPAPPPPVLGRGMLAVTPAPQQHAPLVATQAAFALTGQAANLVAARALTATQASFTLTGVAANFVHARAPLTAAQASFALTGQTTGLIHARAALVATQASFSLTGQNAILTGPGGSHSPLVAAQASFTVTLEPANLTAQRALTAAQASFALTGIAPTLTGAHQLAATQASYVITGEPANLVAARKIAPPFATFTLTGSTTNLTRARPPLTAAQASFALAGQATLFERHIVMSAVQASFVLSMQPASLSSSNGTSDSSGGTGGRGRSRYRPHFGAT